ncbi:MAG: type III-B CRISPR module RAMP protein Cmr4 [bacterium]|nr:type III-B CRISPR module RAMP protein Cmr4 [bacterium]
MKMRPYFMQTLSGLHCGVGQGLSDIDLPTAKDSVTGHPFVPGSSIKGVLRNRFDDGTGKATAAFGSPSGSSVERAAALSFTDSRLICLPVRSYFGTFALLASSCSLKIVKNELQRAGFQNLPPIPSFPTVQQNENFHGLVCTETRLLHRGQFADRLLLEELDLLVQADNEHLADHWADLIGGCLYPQDEEAQQHFKRGFAIVDDNIFDFLCETALPVAAHNRIGENGVVAEGQLWYEEFVPAEAIFVGAVYGQGARTESGQWTSSELLNFICADRVDIQVGGSATTGRGLVAMVFADDREEHDAD